MNVRQLETARNRDYHSMQEKSVSTVISVDCQLINQSGTEDLRDSVTLEVRATYLAHAHKLLLFHCFNKLTTTDRSADPSANRSSNR